MNANKESTTVKSHSQNMEKNDEAFKRKLPVSNEIRKDETDIASSLSEEGPENCPKSERSSESISMQPQTLNDKDSDGPISTDDGTSLSNGGVRYENDVENMTAIHREPQGLVDPLLRVTSEEKVETLATKERSNSRISEISAILKGKGNKTSATPVTTTSDEVDVQVTKVTSSASKLHETKGDTSSSQVQSSAEAMGLPEKNPGDAHVNGTASMTKELEGKPSHHKDHSVDDSEKMEKSPQAPDSPSKTKVISALHSTQKDEDIKKPQKGSEPNSMVTELASAINADPDMFRKKKTTKEETKSRNTGSVLSMIKKIQKTTNKKKEKVQPRGKVKISPKFDDNGKDDHAFTFKHTDTSVPGKTEKMIASAIQNEKKTSEAIDDPDERDMTDKAFRDEVAAKLKRLSHGDEGKDATDTVAEGKTESEAPDVKLEEQVSRNGQMDDKDSNDNYTKLAVDKNCKRSEAMELANGLGSNMGGNAESRIVSLDHATSPRDTEQSQEPTKSSLETTVSVRQTNDAIQGSSFEDISNDNTENRDIDQAFASVAKNDNIEDTILHEESVTKKNMGASGTSSVTLVGDNIIPENERAIITTTDQLDQPGEINESHSRHEMGTNVETIPSFTKHELFFTSAKVDDSPDDAEDEINAENLKKSTSVLSDIPDTIDIDDIHQQNNTNTSSSDTTVDISMKGYGKMKLVDDATFENVWNIVEGKSDKLISDAESDNISNFNKSLSASTASLDSNLSSDVKKLKDEHLLKVDASKTHRKSSGNKMSKPECMQRNSRGQSLEHLEEIVLENKENLNTKSQPRKMIDIKTFEALKV